MRSCLRSHEIVAEPFLIVGILAGIKEIVVLSVEAATLLDKGPDFSRAVVEIGVLGGVVLVLALAAFVLRERRRSSHTKTKKTKTKKAVNVSPTAFCYSSRTRSTGPFRPYSSSDRVALLVAQFNTLLRLKEAPAKVVMLEVLDGLLLIFIFVELLYAVRSCLRSHEIVAEPFLIVGILAGIKEIVVLSVEAATLLDKGPDFARAVVEIGVLGAVVLVLALAAFVLRERRRDTADAGEEAAQEQGPGSG